ncbi:galanin receptor 2a-like [Haliotis rubra]|uniref:galanin receptor 2a-like n=1 Tax=Haliotis rubra TaxID=36100 RepID=UPI001EE56BB7|nr:galanin receptor 2a-like [Haliotis rubra]
MAGITLNPPLPSHPGDMNITYILSTGTEGETGHNISLDSETNPQSDYVDQCTAKVLPHLDLTQITSVALTIVVIYSVIIFLAVTGNVLVIWTVIRNKYMHTVTNYYIVNLAISDLLVSSIVMPLKLMEYTAPCEWHVFSSDTLCSVLSYLLPIFVFTSVLTLVAISLERYYAIVHPLSAMKINSKSRTRKIIAATWLIPIVLASPYLYCRSYAFAIGSRLGQISRQICVDRFDDIDVAMYGEEAWGTGRFRQGFFIFLFLAIYLIPMITILVTCIMIAICLLQPICIKRSPQLGRKDARRRHEENKRKVARMVIVIAIAFIVAWSPQYWVSIVSQIQASYNNGSSFLHKSNFLFTMLMTHLSGFLNSCINPFIYSIMSKKFRRSFKQIIATFLCCCVSKHIFRYQDSMNATASHSYAQTTRQSMTDVRDTHDCHISEAASSGGSSSGGASQHGRGSASSRRSRETKPNLDKSGKKSTGFGRSWTAYSKDNKPGYNIMLKCLKKEPVQKKDAEKNQKSLDKKEPVSKKITDSDTDNVQSDTCLIASGSSKTYRSNEFLNAHIDTCSDSIDSDVELATSRDQINAIREEHEMTLKPSNGHSCEGAKHSHYILNGKTSNGNCVRL